MEGFTKDVNGSTHFAHANCQNFEQFFFTYLHTAPRNQCRRNGTGVGEGKVKKVVILATVCWEGAISFIVALGSSVVLHVRWYDLMLLVCTPKYHYTANTIMIWAKAAEETPGKAGIRTSRYLHRDWGLLMGLVRFRRMIPVPFVMLLLPFPVSHILSTEQKNHQTRNEVATFHHWHLVDYPMVHFSGPY